MHRRPVVPVTQHLDRLLTSGFLELLTHLVSGAFWGVHGVREGPVGLEGLHPQLLATARTSDGPQVFQLSLGPRAGARPTPGPGTHQARQDGGQPHVPAVTGVIDLVDKLVGGSHVPTNTL